MSKLIMLSFDTEEYDVPREHGVEITMDESMKVSRYGANRILDCLKDCGVRATFFCTTNFAERAPEVMQRIIDEGHEVASHGCDHWQPKPEHVIRSKQLLEATLGIPIRGYRQPRMFHVDLDELHRQGYAYNASLNPAFIPGRYMHLTMPRTAFMEQGVLQIPASVSPWLRIPMFWLSLHHFPLWLYRWLLHRIVRHDGYFNTYFHPWEFYPLGDHSEYRMPYLIRHHAGDDMYQRLRSVIKDCQAHGYKFSSYSEFADTHIGQ